MKTYRKIPIVCFQLLLVLGLLLGTQATVKADQYSEGKAAYEAGDYQKALEKLKPLAEQGHAEAQFEFGRMYVHGKGVLENHTEGVKWYRKAAEQGNSSAQNALGHMYKYGEGVPQDYIQAHKWYNLAASSSQGELHSRSMRNRDFIEKKLTPALVVEAQKLAREWKPKTWEELLQQN